MSFFYWGTQSWTQDLRGSFSGNKSRGITDCWPHYFINKPGCHLSSWHPGHMLTHVQPFLQGHFLATLPLAWDCCDGSVGAASGLVEPRAFGLGLLTNVSRALLYSSRSAINLVFVVHVLTEGALYPFSQIMIKDIKQDWKNTEQG